MKILLFGKIGSGKSFVGEIIQREFGITYHDADLDLPDSVSEAIRSHRPITEHMRDEFADRIIERIHSLSHQDGDFCIAQALFKDRHRQRLIDEFPDLAFVWVTSSPELIDLRLRTRTGHIASQYYAEMVNPHFEPPSGHHYTLENSKDLLTLRTQIESLLSLLRDGQPNKSAHATARG